MIVNARPISEVTEPISLAECYQHLRLAEFEGGGRPDDELVMAYLAAARMHCEARTGIALGMQDFEVVLSSFPETIELPYPPFIALLNGIEFTDGVTDTEIDAELYTVDTWSGDTAVISPVSSWPTQPEGHTIRLRYSAGYGAEPEAAAPLPAPVRAAILLMLGHLYANREAVDVNSMMALPLGVDSLLRPYSVRLGAA